MDQGERNLWLILGAILMISFYASQKASLGSRPAKPPFVKNVFFEMPKLETERLILRKVQPEDVKDLFEIYADPQVAQYVPWEPINSLEDSAKWIAEHFEQYKKGKPACWVIEHKEEKRVIGWCGFLRWRPKNGRANIYTAIARKYWRCGYMTEAKRVVIAYAFTTMGFNSILSYIHPLNKAAIRVNEKLGFRTVGTIPEYSYCKGSYQDRICMCLLRRDFLGGVDDNENSSGNQQKT